MRDDGDARRHRARRAAHSRMEQIADPADIERDPVDLHAPGAFGAANRPRNLLRSRDAAADDYKKRGEPQAHHICLSA